MSRSSQDLASVVVHGINTEPSTVHELITRRMVEELTEEVREVRTRVNGLIFVVVGAVLVQILGKAGGWL